MRIEINGTVRDIANSAWISTIDDVSAKSRSDEEVDRVTTFLAKNFHTSPFECISMTYFWLGVAPDGITDLLKSKYTRSYLASNGNEESHLTIDLWNFIKISAEARAENFYETIVWKLFREFDPRLASKAGMFDFSLQKFYKTPDASESLGDTNMRVELISVHNTGDRLTSRATWRIKCPLSIATQILRHRTGSFNQVSGRYRTVKNEFIANFSDISEILNKIAGNNYYSEYMNTILSNITKYEELMLLAKDGKRNEVISNEEYKRIREVARYILPEGRMTELYVTFYLNDFDRYLLLRDSLHAQVEHIWVAQMMKKELNKELDNNK